MTFAPFGPLAPLEEFPSRHEFVQLSAANVAPTARRCYAAVAQWQESVFLRGAAEFDDAAEEQAFEPLRVAGAKLFGCSVQDIAGGSSCSELLSSLAWALLPAKGSNIVGAAACFPSTFYCWARVAAQSGAEVRLAPHDENVVTSEDAILGLIDEHTAIVALSHVEFTSGQLYDLPRIARAAHAVGAKLIVDGTQSVGMIPMDVSDPAQSADAIACAGYKWLCGAFGAAVMYVSPALQALTPGLVGFRSHESMWDTDASRLVFPEGARRFEFATMHFGSALGLAAAIELQLDLGLSRIWTHCLKVADYLIAQVAGLPLTVISPQGPQRSAIVSLRLHSASSSAIEHRLRTDFKVVVTSRGPFLRVSPHVYNDSADIDKLVAALAVLLGAARPLCRY